MKTLIASVAASAFVLASSTAYAGGPVIVEEEVEVVAEKPTSSVDILLLLSIPIILCVALCGGDDGERRLTKR